MIVDPEFAQTLERPVATTTGLRRIYAHRHYRQRLCWAGIGRLLSPNGSQYDGQWALDAKHGLGVRFNARGERIQCGRWEKDVFKRKQGVPLKFLTGKHPSINDAGEARAADAAASARAVASPMPDDAWRHSVRIQDWRR